MCEARNWIWMIHSCVCLFLYHDAFTSPVNANGGWTPFSPRPEISPQFKFSKRGGPDHDGSWIIEQGLEKSQIGAWSREYKIAGGSYYGFEAFGLGKGVLNQRANCYVEIFFFHDQNRQLVIDQRTGNFSRPFYPWGEEQENGWIKFGGVVRVPKEAKKLAIIRLFLRWEPLSQD